MIFKEVERAAHLFVEIASGRAVNPTATHPAQFSHQSLDEIEKGYYLQLNRTLESRNEDASEDQDIWLGIVKLVANEWRHRLSKLKSFEDFRYLHSDKVSDWDPQMDKVPPVVMALWDNLYGQMKKRGEGDIFRMWGQDDESVYLFHLTLTLHAISDLACVGWGIRRLDDRIDPSAAKAMAKNLLSRNGTLSSIHPSRARILPKRHTPEFGITLRSVSSKMCYHRSSVNIQWYPNGPRIRSVLGKPRDADGNPSTTSDGHLSVLLLPWPLVVRTQDYDVTRSPDVRRAACSLNTGMFRFCPDEEDASIVRAELVEALAAAKEETHDVHMVVLPELALSEARLDTVEEILKQASVPAYITGVRTGGRGTTPFGNSLCAGLLNSDGVWHRQWQKKHHPWFLNAEQIVRYGLGAVLHPQHLWQEDIPIERREVTFLNLGDDLTICPLICEDLARQDPVSDVIRSVGPSLVVALLLDGPQVKNRWPGRYASVLSDDPGCAVLTLTAHGMVRRYRTGSHAKSNAIAFWCDRQGYAEEIALETGSRGVLLTLAIERVLERTVDGRDDSENLTYSLTFGGTHQVGARK